MRAASFVVVLLIAKSLALAGRHIFVPLPALPAYFWQDALSGLVAALADAAVRRPRIGWLVYGVLVCYVAINLPVTVLLSSPLTWPMIHAARGPLSDSVAQYVGWAILGGAIVVVLAGALLPMVLRRGGRPACASVFLLAGTLALVGVRAAGGVDTAGLDRNALTALLFSPGLPPVEASTVSPDWRRSPFPESAVLASPAADAPGVEDLTRFRGAARGLNVLLVILESTGARYLEPYGAAEDPTPNFTALARRSLLFENAYSVYPESIKGLFATLCSRYPGYGVVAEAHAGVDCASIARALSSAGYHTALFHSGRFRYLGMQDILDRQGFGRLEDAGAIGGNVRSSFGVDEPATVSQILAWIDAQGSGPPFFVAYLPIAGHHPYAIPDFAPVPFAATSDLARYRNALHYGDAALGSLLAGLEGRKLLDRTLVLLMGDHGEAFEQHPGNIGHTLFINEENVRVPYVIALPRGLARALDTPPEAARTSTSSADQEPRSRDRRSNAAGLRIHRVVSLLDTAPTILDLLGLPRDGGHQGVSVLLPGLRMALFYTDYSLGWLGLRDGCRKYLYEINANRSRLYDVCLDPDETVDVSDAQRERVRAYRDRVIEWSATQRRLIQVGSSGRSPSHP